MQTRSHLDRNLLWDWAEAVATEQCVLAPVMLPHLEASRRGYSYVVVTDAAEVDRIASTN